MSAVTYVKFNV